MNPATPDAAPLRTVLVEDEPLALQTLRRFASADNRLTLVGELLARSEIRQEGVIDARAELSCLVDNGEAGGGAGH